jgi:hypothetical protein
MSLKQTVAKLQNGHDSLKQELDQVKSDNKVLSLSDILLPEDTAPLFNKNSLQSEKQTMTKSI